MHRTFARKAVFLKPNFNEKKTVPPLLIADKRLLLPTYLDEKCMPPMYKSAGLAGGRQTLRRQMKMDKQQKNK